MDVLTTENYWDCECEDEYIHPAKELYCIKCDRLAKNQPDSIYAEVASYLLETDIREFDKMHSEMFDEVMANLNQLKVAYEHKEIYYKTMISTLEGGAGQQERLMKEKDKRIKELEDTINSLSMTHVNTEELNSVIKELEAEVRSLLEQNEIMYGYVEKYMPKATNMRVISSTDTGVVGPEDNPFSKDPAMPVSEPYWAIGRGMQPYPFTHPVRDIPDYSKVRV